jgi:hypothetical protein
MKKLVKLAVVSLVAANIGCGAALADPKPFGLELGKATKEAFKKKYPDAEYKGLNSYSLGSMYSVPTYKLPLDGVQEDTFIFDLNGKLVAVLLTLPKYQFDKLLPSLKRKYRLVSSQIPFVGNKSAKFVDGKSEVTMDAPHMSFEMDLLYARKSFLNAFHKSQQKKAEEKRKRTEGAL